MKWNGMKWFKIIYDYLLFIICQYFLVPCHFAWFETKLYFNNFLNDNKLWVEYVWITE